MNITGEENSDIKLDAEFQPMIGSDGAPCIVSNDECFMQDIMIEAVCEEAELFDETEDTEDAYGFGLLDFINEDKDEFLEEEIRQRIHEKMQKREFIDEGTITVKQSFEEDTNRIGVSFRKNYSDDEYNIDLTADSVEVNIQ